MVQKIEVGKQAKVKLSKEDREFIQVQKLTQKPDTLEVLRHDIDFTSTRCFKEQAVVSSLLKVQSDRIEKLSKELRESNVIGYKADMKLMCLIDTLQDEAEEHLKTKHELISWTGALWITFVIALAVRAILYLTSWKMNIVIAVLLLAMGVAHVIFQFPIKKEEK